MDCAKLPLLISFSCGSKPSTVQGFSGDVSCFPLLLVSHVTRSYWFQVLEVVGLAWIIFCDGGCP